MFSQVSVYSWGWTQGVVTSHASWDKSRGTIIPSPEIRAGDLHPIPRHHAWGSNSLLLTSGGHHWRPVQNCSLEDVPTLHVLTSSGGHQNG